MTKSSKKRLDQFLTEEGYFPSREKAATSILAGWVFVNEERAIKASQKVSPDAVIRIKQKPPFVSRGGEKLAHAFKHFPISCQDLITADLGASTGGFTDCLLQNGAQKVYAVDVGYGQIDYKLREDPRVILMEKTNARYLTQKNFKEEIEFLTGDLSFISLKKILPAIALILKSEGTAVLLIKPQFEAKKEEVARGGVIRDDEIKERVIEEVEAESIRLGFTSKKVIASPLRGPAGNEEFLIWLVKN